MKKLVQNSSVPLYLQLEQSIREGIQKGKYAYGERIPTELELQEIFGVSRITVRNAIQTLCESGLLVKRPGKGTYVSFPVVKDSYTAGGSFTISCQQIGVAPTTKVIQQKEGVRIGESKEDLIQIDRLRLVDGIPAIYEIDYFLGQHAFMLDADVENTPLMDTLTAKTGLRIGGFENEFEAVYADAWLAKHLKCPQKSALLLVKQKVLSTDDEIIYYNYQYVRSEIYKFTTKTKG